MLPFTEKENELITEYYRYAIKVAYNIAYRPYDDHEINTVAHDALMIAVKYYKEGKNFKSFFKRCLLQKLSNAYKKRSKIHQIQISKDFDFEDSKSIKNDFEDKEIVFSLKKKLTGKQCGILYQLYDLNMKQKDVAKSRNVTPIYISVTHKKIINILRHL